MSAEYLMTLVALDLDAKTARFVASAQTLRDLTQHFNQGRTFVLSDSSTTPEPERPSRDDTVDFYFKLHQQAACERDQAIAIANLAMSEGLARCEWWKRQVNVAGDVLGNVAAAIGMSSAELMSFCGVDGIEEIGRRVGLLQSDLRTTRERLENERNVAIAALEDIAQGRERVQCLVARPGEGTLECRADSLCASCRASHAMRIIRERLAEEQAEHGRWEMEYRELNLQWLEVHSQLVTVRERLAEVEKEDAELRHHPLVKSTMHNELTAAKIRIAELEQEVKDEEKANDDEHEHFLEACDQRDEWKARAEKAESELQREREKRAGGVPPRFTVVEQGQYVLSPDGKEGLSQVAPNDPITTAEWINERIAELWPTAPSPKPLSEEDLDRHTKEWFKKAPWRAPELQRELFRELLASVASRGVDIAAEVAAARRWKALAKKLYLYGVNGRDALVTAARAEEREACIVICEDVGRDQRASDETSPGHLRPSEYRAGGAAICANRIRARAEAKGSQ